MIANRKLAGIAFVGGATLALLAGCVEVPATATHAQPVPLSASAIYEILQQRRTEIEQQNALRQEFAVEPDDDAPAVQAPRRKRSTLRRAPVDDSPVVSENPPATPAPVAKETPVAKAPADPSCVGWWRVCHFL
jgi:hypothetical protein